MKIKIDDNFFWRIKHWGLGISGLLIISGSFLALPYDMVSWKKGVRQAVFLNQRYVATTYFREDEKVTNGYQISEITYAQPAKKLFGFAIALAGSGLLWLCSEQLVTEYEYLERTNWKVRQSEKLISDTFLVQNTEVERARIEFEAQMDIGRMRKPAVDYIPKEEEKEAEEEIQEGYTFDSDGYLLYLLDKEIRQSSVKALSQKRFNKDKPSIKQIRFWIDELVEEKVAEWLTEDKTEFRLLNKTE